MCVWTCSRVCSCVLLSVRLRRESFSANSLSSAALPPPLSLSRASFLRPPLVQHYSPGPHPSSCEILPDHRERNRRGVERASGDPRKSGAGRKRTCWLEEPRYTSRRSTRKKRKKYKEANKVGNINSNRSANWKVVEVNYGGELAKGMTRTPRDTSAVRKISLLMTFLKLCRSIFFSLCFEMQIKRRQCYAEMLSKIVKNKFVGKGIVCSCGAVRIRLILVFIVENW